MNRRSFLGHCAGVVAGSVFAGSAVGEPMLTGDSERCRNGRTCIEYAIAEWDSDGFLVGTPGWTGAYVVDLDTGKQLQYGGRNAEIRECSARDGWVIVQDHYTPKGDKYLWEHDEILTVHVQGNFEITNRLP